MDALDDKIRLFVLIGYDKKVGIHYFRVGKSENNVNELK